MHNLGNLSNKFFDYIFLVFFSKKLTKKTKLNKKCVKNILFYKNFSRILDSANFESVSDKRPLKIAPFWEVVYGRHLGVK